MPMLRIWSLFETILRMSCEVLKRGNSFYLFVEENKRRSDSLLYVTQVGAHLSVDWCRPTLGARCAFKCNLERFNKSTPAGRRPSCRVSMAQTPSAPISKATRCRARFSRFRSFPPRLPTSSRSARKTTTHISRSQKSGLGICFPYHT